MPKLYTEFAGRSLDRLSALSDGIFAFSMTLLVLDIHVPSREAVHSGEELAAALIEILPSFTTWLMSLMILGIFWVGQQTQLCHLRNSDRNYTWYTLTLLAFVTAIPFSTKLLTAFIHFRLALLLYWANVFFIGALIYISWNYACRHKLIKPEVTEEVYRAVKRRVFTAQALYAFGAALCVFNNYWSIGFIVAVQLNYVFAPRIPFLYELTA